MTEPDTAPKSAPQEAEVAKESQPADAAPEEQSADSADSKMGRVQVSMSKSRGFYAGVARRYLRGVDGKPPLDEITLTALGSAIASAAGVSHELQHTNTAIITKVETSYTDRDKQLTKAGRNLPRITIVMKKHPEFKDEEPAPAPAVKTEETGEIKKEETAA
eukprot:Selendium_serpulae@DN6121_c0_g1_i15.p2